MYVSNTPSPRHTVTPVHDREPQEGGAPLGPMGPQGPPWGPRGPLGPYRAPMGPHGLNLGPFGAILQGPMG